MSLTISKLSTPHFSTICDNIDSYFEILQAWKLWIENKALDLIDATIRETCNANELLRCVGVGLLCVQEDPNDRPTMSNVLFMLGSEAASLPNPKQPAFVVRRSSLSSSASSSKPELETVNELTSSLKIGR